MKPIRIFVSSPGDVAEERALTKRVVQRLQGEFGGLVHLEPVFWEHEPLLATASFQEQITKPSQSDITICLLWSRLGTRLPPHITRDDGSTFASGTEYEFEDAVSSFRSSGRPQLLVYRKQADPRVSLRDKGALLDRLSQKEALDRFSDLWFHDGAQQTLIAAFHPFESAADYEELVEVHLRKLISAQLPPPEEGRLPSAPPAWQQGSPYRGLETFEFEHAAVFFGRTRAVADILDALRQQAADGRTFVVILGMSGGGKSSVARAGVLPMIVQPGVIEGVAAWRKAIFRPSDAAGDLFAGLATALLREPALPELDTEGGGRKELAEVLRTSPLASAALVKQSLALAAGRLTPSTEAPEPPRVHLALLIDQMEEIFREDVSFEERQRLVAVLDALARSGRVWVLATLRSDFYPRIAELDTLVALKEGAGHYDLRPPKAAEIGQIIRLPTRAAGLRFEEDSVTGEHLEDLLRDAAVKNAGILPLLEFTLEELYKRRSDDGCLTLAAYRELAGVEGSLAKRAEEVFVGLGPEVQAALPRVLNALVSIGREGAVARRRLPWTSVDTPEARTLLSAFVEARLFVSELADDGGAVVSIAHEALLSHWSRIETWLEENREHLRIRDRVRRAAARWHQEGQSADYLLAGGKPLAEAETLIGRPEIRLDRPEEELIAASLGRARRIRWLKRGVVAGLAVLTVAAAGATYLYYKEGQRARVEAETARQTTEFLTGLFEVSDPGESRGNTITAREILDKGADRIERELADQPQTQARMMRTMGDVYRNLGLYEQAQELLERSLAIHEQDPSRSEEELAAKLDSLAGVYNDQADWSKSKPLLERALEIRERILGADHSDVAQSLNNLGVCLLSGGTGDPEPLFLRSLAIREEALGPDHEEVAWSLTNLADYYARRRRYSEALPLAERALEIRERTLGPDHPDVGRTLLSVAGIQRELESFAKAEPLYERALAIHEKALGPEHIRVAETLSGFADNYEEQGDAARAETLHRRALEIAEAAMGSDSLRCEPYLARLARFYVRTDRPATAEPLYRQARSIVEKTLAPDHPNVANVLYNLADVHFRLEEYAKAEPLYRRVLEIDEKRLGPENPEVAWDLSDLARVYSRLGDHAKAEPLYQRALAIQKTAFGPDDRRLTEILEEYSALLRAAGRDMQAAELEEQLAAIP